MPIDPEVVLGPADGRKKLVIIGGAETTAGLGDQIRDADVLTIEATFLGGSSGARRQDQWEAIQMWSRR